MLLTFKSRRDLSRILPFAVIWLLFSIVYSIVEKGLLGDLKIYPSTGNPYSFRRNILITPGAALLTGLLIGVFEIKYLSKFFLHMSFGRKITYKTLTYFLITVVFLISISLLANAAELGISILDKKVIANAWLFFSNFSFWSVSIFMGSVFLVSQFYTEVSENLGHEVLRNFFTGRYHRPKEEERIFMFLDMKSSTTIAEAVGHSRYFELLREYYADLSEPVILHAGEIYQYVGDEMVISWKLKDGVQGHNCIACFFAMQQALQQRSGEYSKKFGYAPGFKAALHCGKVTTGEIGTIKKEIIFTGDVLNATARIQALCNGYQADLILSEDLKNQFETTPGYRLTALGENELKGRDRKMNLFSVLAMQENRL